MPHAKPATIWRANTDISTYLGQTGTVRISTKIHSRSKNSIGSLAYSIGLIDLDDGTSRMFEILNPKKQKIEPGTKIQLVSRKFTESERGAIRYTLKASLI